MGTQVLDCESLESALRSIAILYSVDEPKIVKFLKSVDLDHEFATKRIDMDAADYLQRLFHERFGTPQRPFENICWFHLTRVSPDANFSEGILPLHLALDKVWKTVSSIPQQSEIRAKLEQLRLSGVPNGLYQMKIAGPTHSGPFALLVRETAFCPESMGNVDYLGLPEIIEDICLGYREAYGADIQSEIAAGLVKCIVKFEVKSKDDAEAGARALQYCWTKIRNQELNWTMNWCYDGHGATIPRSAIRRIEFLRD